ncbi:MAG: CHAT domain-containing protein [Anaerolineae bacterium]|nr:CHAT domain-containing protein [Anaerolineae bacterium]
MPSFEVTVLQNAGRYLLRIESPQIGQYQSALDQQALSEAARGLNAQVRLDENALADYGKALFQTLFDQQAQAAFQAARLIAYQQGEPLAFVLRLPTESLLHDIAWELLHNGKEFLVRDGRLTFGRYLEQAAPVQSLALQPPLRILLTTAQPTDQALLNLDSEVQLIQEALSDLRQKVTLVIKKNVDFGQLQHTLLRGRNIGAPFHVWHHCGHGDMTEDGQFILALYRGGGSEYVYGSQLSLLAAQCPELRLAVLNVCYSGAPSGLAAQFAALNVPATIGFRAAIRDSAALKFANALYSALPYVPVEEAVAQARLQLAAAYPYDDPRRTDWTLPILFLRARQSRLFADTQTSLPQQSTAQASQVSKAQGGTIHIGEAIVGGDANISQHGGARLHISKIKVKGDANITQGDEEVN